MRFGTTSALAVAAVVATALLSPPAFASTTVNTPVASDNLNRTVASGLGTSTSGKSYTVSSASSFSVNGSHGVLALPTPGKAASAKLNGVSIADVNAQVDIAIPALPTTGGGVYTSLQLRVDGSNAYYAQVRVAPDRTALLEILRVANGTQTSLASAKLSGTVAAGEKLTLSAAVSGSTSVGVAAKVARTAALDKNVTVSTKDTAATRVTGKGTVGLRSYLSSSTPAQKITFDNFTVTTPGGGSLDSTLTPTATPSPTTAAPKPTASPTPTTVPAPAAPTTNEPTWNVSGARASAGSVRVGTRNDAIPSGAIIVAAGAAASGTGTMSAPYAKLQTAIDKAASGSTIVMRAGTYHETVTIPSGKKLTIQAAPREAVWLDGTQKVSGFTASGSTWYTSNWSYNFDSSPTYTKGASDGTAANWTWLNKAAPMAAHPDQVWVGGTHLTQVNSLAAVKAGTFFVDTAADRLYIGTNPSSGEVRASTLTKALSVRGADSTVRGIGIRGYATSVWMMGTVTLEASGAKLEDVAIYDNATTGVYATTSNITMTRVTAARNGLMGIGASTADGLVLDRVLSLENNREKFNQSPVSGGVKITRTRGVKITGSAFLRNNAPGIWVDESVYDTTITGTDSIGNTGHGVSLELSHKVLFVNNLIKDNSGQGVKINNTGAVTLWNNTIIGGARTLNIVQDSRDASDPDEAGHDPRRPVPDSTMPWLIKDISIGNNVIAASTGNCSVCVEDYSKKHDADDLNIKITGGVVQRTSASAPSWVAVWARGAANPSVYSNLGAFTSATGQAKLTLAVDGKAATTATGQLAAGVGTTANVATPPSTVTAVIGTGKAAGALYPGATSTFK